MMEKPTEEGVQRIVNRIGTLRQRYSRMERIGRIKDLDEWQALKPMLADMAQMHDRAVKSLTENETDMDDHDLIRRLRANQAARDSFQWVITLIEKPKEEADKLLNSITELEESLSSKKQEMEDFGLNKIGQGV